MPDRSSVNYSPAQPPFRILALDGGGIYGLCTAIMLRKLAEKNEKFLAPGAIDLFAGTSAGALNALFLAKQPSPREFVLSGGLERIWFEPLLYSNCLNPLSSYLSLFGVTAFLGSDDYWLFLRQHFDDLTLADLPHNVLIEVFDWSGVEQQFYVTLGASGSASQRHPWSANFFTNLAGVHDAKSERGVVEVAYAAGAPPGLRAIRNGIGDGGIFAPNPALNAISKTLECRSDSLKKEHGDRLTGVANAFCEICVIRGAYLSEALETLEDSASQKLDDILATLSRDLGSQKIRKIKAAIKKVKETESGNEKKKQALRDMFGEELQLVLQLASEDNIDTSLVKDLSILSRLEETLKPTADVDLFLFLNDSAKEIYDLLGPEAKLATLLDSLFLLSIGVCNKAPYYWLKTFDLSGNLFYNQLPTNPLTGDWYPPVFQVLMQAASSNTNMQSEQLLGSRFFRFNPPLVGPPDSPPAAVATLLSRFTGPRYWLLQQIHRAADTIDGQKLFEDTLKFLKGTYYA